MMGFFKNGQAQSESDGGSNVGPGNPGITADVDVDVILPSVDAEIRIGDINPPSEHAGFAGDLNLATVKADVSLLSDESDGSGLGLRLDLDAPNKLLDVHAPGLLEVPADADNGPSDCSDGVHVEVLNGDHLLDVHAPGLLDASIGGAELGQILGASDCNSSGSHGDGIQVGLLSGEHVAEAHVPGLADVTVSAESGGLLHGLDDIVGC